jgi:prophage antirepressor-like protein
MMSNELSIFDFEENAVRVLMRDEQPWFVAVDVCRVLDIANSRDAVSGLDDDEKGVGSADTLGGKQTVNIISESGLYALIFTSRKPEARKFRKWVTSEVLPAIRKSGRYEMADAHWQCVREELEDVLANVQRDCGTAAWWTSQRQMPPDRARAIAALAGRRLEAVKLRMELLGIGGMRHLEPAAA